ncbi:unnamed protein product [Schistosoma margrebowiei]|uniref:Uncharacterized protein n=1 Tax=Schistosoma margrebowiei TaxID=48269 RepID=A0A183LXN2_9TREM|nr:unnamed protein product [Schistosoma margrebowiei]
MEDVRTRIEADIASDNHLVVAKMKLKLKKHWETGETASRKFNTTFLRDTNKLNEFKIYLNNRFQASPDLLKEKESTMEDNWKGIKEALTSTCQEVLGLKKNHHKKGSLWKPYTRFMKGRTRRQQLKTAEHKQRKSTHKLNTQMQTSK